MGRSETAEKLDHAERKTQAKAEDKDTRSGAGPSGEEPANQATGEGGAGDGAHEGHRRTGALADSFQGRHLGVPEAGKPWVEAQKWGAPAERVGKRSRPEGTVRPAGLTDVSRDVKPRAAGALGVSRAQGGTI